MKNTLHIALVFLLGLSVLAGCHREGMPGASAESPELLTKGPVQVNCTISIQDFDQDEVITKADYVDVDAAYRYDYEKKIKDYKKKDTLILMIIRFYSRKIQKSILNRIV